MVDPKLKYPISSPLVTRTPSFHSRSWYIFFIPSFIQGYIYIYHWNIIPFSLRPTFNKERKTLILPIENTSPSRVFKIEIILHILYIFLPCYCPAVLVCPCSVSQPRHYRCPHWCSYTQLYCQGQACRCCCVLLYCCFSDVYSKKMCLIFWSNRSKKL